VIIITILALTIIFILIFDFRPVKRIRFLEDNILDIKDINIDNKISFFKVIAHVHTQFSFDSLGKPSDIEFAIKHNKIDYVFITDHDNDDFKYFSTDKTSAGIELNTKDGRLLLLDNKLPVISHPNNFEFEHYRWKGEFKKEYLYELINVKDAIVWKKYLSILTALKNLFLLPFSRNPYRKWNSLLPLEKWVDLYFKRAKGLKIIGGLDIHVKFVYQEHTNGVLIPSYKRGFKWVVNHTYLTDFSDINKDKILEALKLGNNIILINGFGAKVWVNDGKDIYTNGDKIPVNSFINCQVETKKFNSVKILKRDNVPILITEKNEFSFHLDKKGNYHIEFYEYDFKIGNILFGFRPLGLTNLFEVVDEREKINT